ncbi:Carbamate kinase 1 [bioreactor metagenome]|jgi:carbamate kinase|uniref:Carbamate kinase 1 n=1 Tax=bioreactor metagenome TaxID=1076179 RepID=A0A644TC24_9ZZZZ|nr:amino acid (carbamate) kinase [uncultured Spirochaetota bacterium]HOI23236.1 carbamate kinase [Spirochaetales bacterium]
MIYLEFAAVEQAAAIAAGLFASLNKRGTTMKERKTIVVALGGNAIIEEGTEGTITQQFANTRKSLTAIVDMIAQGHRVVLTHGNGPQAGVHLIRNEAASSQVPPSPLGVIVADTQGSMGYMIAQSLANALNKAGLRKEVVTLITQVVVDPQDPSMLNPTKYVGPFYRAEQVEQLSARGWIIKEDPGRGYRRVVPSPLPLDVVEKETIRDLLRDGKIVIAAGGGGVPVCREKDGSLEGVDAVIDKDRASALLASLIAADQLIILTGVEKVAINFKKPDQRFFDRLSVTECERFLAEGQFPRGSMGPKIEAACDFVKRGGAEVIITSMENASLAVEGRAGTVISA